MRADKNALKEVLIMKHSASMVVGSCSVTVATTDSTPILPGVKKIMTIWKIKGGKVILTDSYLPGLRNPGGRRKMQLPKEVVQAIHRYVLQLVKEGRTEEPMKPGQLFREIDGRKPYELQPDLADVVRKIKSIEN